MRLTPAQVQDIYQDGRLRVAIAVQEIEDTLER